MQIEHYQFEEGKKRVEAKSTPEILYAISDLRATIAIQEHSTRLGGHCPKLGFYWDDLCTHLAILKRRQSN